MRLVTLWFVMLFVVLRVQAIVFTVNGSVPASGTTTSSTSCVWETDKDTGFTVRGPVTNEGAITALRLVVRDTNGNVWCQITPTNFVFGTNTFRLDLHGNIEAANSDALLYSVQAGLFSGYFAGDGFSLTNITINSLNFTNLPSGGKCLMVDAMGDLYFGDAAVADLHSNAVQKTGSAITGPLRVVADTWVAQSFDVAPPSTVSLGTGASWSAASGISISMFGTQCTVSNANAVGAGVLYVSGEVWRVTSGSGGGFSFSFCPRSDATALFSDMTYSPATGSSTNFEATFSSTGKCNVVAFSAGGSGSPATWSISNLTVRWTPEPLVNADGSSKLTLAEVTVRGNQMQGPLAFSSGIAITNPSGNPITIGAGSYGAANDVVAGAGAQARHDGVDSVVIGVGADTWDGEAIGPGSSAQGNPSWWGYGKAVAHGPSATADRMSLASGASANADQGSTVHGNGGTAYGGGVADGLFAWAVSHGGGSPVACGTMSASTTNSVSVGGYSGATSPTSTNATRLGYFTHAEHDGISIGAFVSNPVQRSAMIAVGPDLRFFMSDDDTNFVYLLNTDGTTNGKIAWTR